MSRQSKRHLPCTAGLSKRCRGVVIVGGMCRQCYRAKHRILDGPKHAARIQERLAVRAERKAALAARRCKCGKCDGKIYARGMSAACYSLWRRKRERAKRAASERMKAINARRRERSASICVPVAPVWTGCTSIDVYRQAKAERAAKLEPLMLAAKAAYQTFLDSFADSKRHAANGARKRDAARRHAEPINTHNVCADGAA